MNDVINRVEAALRAWPEDRTDLEARFSSGFFEARRRLRYPYLEAQRQLLTIDRAIVCQIRELATRDGPAGIRLVAHADTLMRTLANHIRDVDRELDSFDAGAPTI